MKFQQKKKKKKKKKEKEKEKGRKKEKKKKKKKKKKKDKKLQNLDELNSQMDNLILEKRTKSNLAFQKHFIYKPKELEEIDTSTLFLGSLIDFLISPREISEHEDYVIVREVISVLISFIASPLFTLSQNLQEDHSIDDIPLEICLKSNLFLRFFANLQEKKSKKLSAILIEYSIKNFPLPNPPSSAWSSKSGK
ncbi:hypothetical protein M0812_26855 [Anaeramoeba flamelloides]|uniref:Uncharacterized protein n=1 Tax=Anaeramoeba flamelloides TaxID=1746091 RepID=A0AAV7YFJ3_9EUKA|nr:hypothetical protein M0812_26855 [Anaeramoeba flamelloides]